MGAALLLTVWITYRGVGHASEALVRGQAAVLQADLRGEFREIDGRATDEDLQSMVESYSDSGLHFIAIVSRKGVVAQAGTRAPDPKNLERVVRSLRRGEPNEYGEVIRLLLRPKVGRAAYRHRGGEKGAPPIYIEFSPNEAQALLSSSRRSLAAASGVALLLLVMAGLLARWFVRQDRNRSQQETDRRLKSLGEMSAVLAHEIRNPLASLKGNAQILDAMIEKEGAPESKTKAKAERVVSEATRLEALINDLLNFARSGELHPSETNPGELLTRCAGEIEGQIDIDVGGAPKTWLLDGARMQQVLSNLLHNAVDASERVEASARVESGCLVFTVRDHGAGLDESDRERLFEPFVTKKVQGTGLGLAVAKRLVDLHGGTISARNADGGGALFRVELPVGS